MLDYAKYWKRGRVRYHLLVRAGCPWRTWFQIRWWLRRLWWGRYEGGSWGEVSLRHLPRCSSICYCPTGSTSEIRLALFGWGVWFSLGRDWTPRPCLCQRVSWSVFPGNNWDDIEEYGEAKLRQEFPDLWAEWDRLNPRLERGSQEAGHA